jgi:hypothetical protein
MKSSCSKNGRIVLALVALGSLFHLAPACSSSDSEAPGGSTGNTSTSASGSTGAGGAGVKGGGQKGTAAVSSKQHGGSTAQTQKSSAMSQGSNVQGIVCDASLEGVGWCVDDLDIVFCSAGTWWILDCSQWADGAFCGYYADANIVDCFAPTGDSGAGGAGGFGSSGEGGFGGGDACAPSGSTCGADDECCSQLCDIDTGLCD